jgi:uncharacterized Zn-binding protein involved in type VI secretion
LRARRLAAAASPRNRIFEKKDSIEMKLLTKALGFGLAVSAASAACAAAASLAFATQSLSAGSAAVTSCGISSLGATRDVDNSGNVTQVVVPAVPAACAGETFSITLVDGSNAALGSASATVPAGGGAMTFSSFGATVSATNLMGYRVAVVGA